MTVGRLLAQDAVAIDFAVVPTATFRLLFVFVVPASSDVECSTST